MVSAWALICIEPIAVFTATGFGGLAAKKDDRGANERVYGFDQALEHRE